MKFPLKYILTASLIGATSAYFSIPVKTQSADKNHNDQSLEMKVEETLPINSPILNQTLSHNNIDDELQPTLVPTIVSEVISMPLPTSALEFSGSNFKD